MFDVRSLLSCVKCISIQFVVEEVRMKKALIVANLGGFASFLLNDMDTLIKMGYQVSYAANADKLDWDDTKEKLQQKGVEFLQVDFDSKNPFSSQNIKAYKQIVSILKNGKYDLIHCHTPIVGLLVRMAAKKYRRKGATVIYTTHGLAFTSNSSFKSKLIYKNMEHFGARLCDAIVTINREDYQNCLKMHCRKVYYIHGVGVDTSKYEEVDIDRSAYRNSIGISDNDIMVLSVGELSDRKNHQIIIEALSRIADKGKYVYVICGNGINGGTGEMLRELAEKKSVRLILLGFRHDIPEITVCSDIGAIPSVREGLGLAGIQSLAAGVPVVGTDVQGIRDYIRDGENGFLCSAFDADGFAEAIGKISSLTADHINKMKESCHSVAREFDVDISKKEMENIYEELLAQN